MPIYVYRCGECGEDTELLASVRAFKKEGAPPCSACGSDRMKRVPAASTFILKGSGWSGDGYSKPK